jgi:hypothetical protein
VGTLKTAFSPFSVGRTHAHTHTHTDTDTDTGYAWAAPRRVLVMGLGWVTGGGRGPAADEADSSGLLGPAVTIGTCAPGDRIVPRISLTCGLRSAWGGSALANAVQQTDREKERKRE